MPSGPPVVVRDGSLRIETDEPIDLDTETLLRCRPDELPPRPYLYNRRSDDIHIRRVVVRQGKKVLLNAPFDPRECTIEIYWDPEDPLKGEGERKL